MIVTTQVCCRSGDQFDIRLSIPYAGHEYIDGREWTRKTAKEALDLLEKVYHIPRKTIRFRHL